MFLGKPLAVTAFCLSSCIFLSTHALAASPAACDAQGAYVGAFGGFLWPYHTDATQTGTAFYPPISGGTLHVKASGNVDSSTSGLGGVHAGYAWPSHLSISNWEMMSAAELEGYYFSTVQKTELFDPASRVPEHTFEDKLPTNSGVFLVNGVFDFNNGLTTLHPYVGAGVGAAIMSVSGADSEQVSPPELRVNHFNGSKSDSSWVFAAQAKAGVRWYLNQQWRLLAEYRYLYLSSSDYTFGPTQYPSHVATSKWNLRINDLGYSEGVVGVEYAL
ncbi:MAG TPA: acyloxyacyl hydrolase [Gammaproteobacteria bacterium]|jgi:opacity protein-like surface antigen|nr:acyloxyacyl hydrolase [Gammaproteobacteria bacterium]